MLTSSILKERAKTLGAHGCGIAGIERFNSAPEGFSPKDIYSKCKSVVVLEKQMPKGAIMAENPVPYTHAAYKMYEELDRLSMELLRCAEEYGVDGVLIPADVPYMYWDQENMVGKGIISLKHAAVQSGLGIMGHNTIFMSPEYGNMVYLGAILLNAELEEDEINTSFSCVAGCNRCIKACPQKAIRDNHVDQKLCREHSFFQVGRGWDLYNCSECRIKCPLRLGEPKIKN